MALAVLLCLALLGAPVSAAWPTELAYDDDSNESSFSGGTGWYAVKVSPEFYGKMRTVEAFMSKEPVGWHGSYMAFVLDGSHNFLAEAAPVKATTAWEWRTRTIPNPKPVLGSDFYVGIRKLTPLYLGSDQSASSGRSEYADANAGPWAVDANNFMIRALFDYYPYVTNVAVDSYYTNTRPFLTATCNEVETSVTSARYMVQADGNWRVLQANDANFDSATEDVNRLVNISLLGDGLHTIDIRCRDTNSNWTYDGNYGNVQFFLDRVAPSGSTSYSGTMGDNNWYTSNVDVTLTGNDPAPASGIKEIYYSLSGSHTQGWTLYSGPFTLTNDGVTTITYQAVDNADNNGAVQFGTVSIDQTPPTAPSLNAFPYDYLNGTSFTVSWSASSDATSTVAYYNIYRDVNAAGFALQDTNTGTWYTDTGMQDDTNYCYYITAVDYAGLEGAQSAADCIAVDRASPAAPSLHALPAYTGSATVTTTWDAPNDPGTYPSGVGFYDVNRDSAIIVADVVAVSDPQSYDDGGRADDTTYTYSIRAKDSSNPAVNIGPWSSEASTTVDITSPSSSHSLAPAAPDGANGWYVSPVTVTLNASDPGANPSGVRDIYYCIDSADACIPITTYTGPFAVSNEGTVYVRYLATDNVDNNEAANSSGALYIDLSNPYGQSIILDGGNTYNTTGNVNADMNTGTDDISGLDYCELSWDNGGAWSNVALATIAGPNAYADGIQTAQYRCYDLSGRVSAAVQDDIIVDTTLPVSTIDKPGQGEIVVKGRILFEGTAFDATSGVNKVQMKAINALDSSTVLDWTDASGTIDWNFFWDCSSLPDGMYMMKSRAEDNAGWQEFDDNVTIFVQQNLGPNMDNVYYLDAGNRYVNLYGYLDLQNKNYTVDVIDLELGLASAAVYSTVVSTDENAYFEAVIDVNSWDANKLYAARVQLYSLDTIYSQFDTFAAAGIIDRLAVIESGIYSLWLDSANQLGMINDLNANIIALGGDLNALNQRVTDLNVEMHALIDDLQGQIDDLNSTLMVMNHATINMTYNSAINVLNVWGEAAYGTLSNVIMILNPSDGVGAAYGDTTPVIGGHNSYQFTTINGNPVDTTLLDPKSYNVLVLMLSPFRPVTASPIFMVGGIFNGLLIDDVNARLTSLENTVDMLNAGNLEFNYNSVAKEATFLGETPTTAQCVYIEAYSSAGTLLATAQVGASENPAGADYNALFDVSAWPSVPVNAFAQFYSSGDCSTGYLSTVNDVFDSLLAEDLVGFRDITTSTFSTSRNVPITYGLKPGAAANYEIVYSVDGNSWQTLNACSAFPEGVRTYGSGIMDMGANPGSKTVKLGARNCATSIVDYNSYEFNIMYNFDSGFWNIVSSTFTHAQTIPISYFLRSPKTTMYEIQYEIDGGGWNTLTACATYVVGEDASNYGYADLVSPGLKQVQLRAVDCGTSNVDMNSYMFWVNFSRPTVTYALPMPNSGVHSSYAGVYWTNGETIDVNALVIADVPSTCLLGYYRVEGSGTVFNIATTIPALQPDGNYLCLFEGIAAKDWVYAGTNNHSHDAYTVLNVTYAHPAGTIDFNIGVDTNAPTISDIDPNAGSTVHGTIIMDANVHDAQSGVSEVWFRLFTKDSFGNNDVLMWAGQADHNAITGRWWVDFNTFLVPDGNYNVDVNARDIAGNEGSEFVDPVVDNTGPVINSAKNWTFTPIFRGERIIIDVNVTDNMSGVDTVWAGILSPDGNLTNTILEYKWDTIYRCEYPTTLGFQADDGNNTYLVAIDANDIAGNLAAEFNMDFNLTYRYLLDITLSSNSVTTGDTVDVNGTLTMDNGSLVGDANIDIAFDGNVYTVAVDANTGLFSLGLNTDTAGTYSVDANITAPNGIDFNDSEMLVVSDPAAPPAAPPAGPPAVGGGGGGGGGGGTGTQVCNNYSCNYVRFGMIYTGYLCKGASSCEGDAWDPKGTCAGVCCKVECAIGLEDENTFVEESPAEGGGEGDSCEGMTCADSNPCTIDFCEEGKCSHSDNDGRICRIAGMMGECNGGTCKILPGQGSGDEGNLAGPDGEAMPIGFFGLGDMGLGTAGIVLIVIIIAGAAIYLLFFRQE